MWGGCHAGDIQIDPAETPRFGVVDVDRDIVSMGFRKNRKKPTCVLLTTQINHRFNGHISVQHRCPDPRTFKGRGGPEFQPRFRKRHLPSMVMNIASMPTTLWTRIKKKRCTGATWGPLKPITRPTWILFRCRRSSICMTPTGQSALFSANIRLPICLRRDGPHGNGGRFDCVGGLHRVRQLG